MGGRRYRRQTSSGQTFCAKLWENDSPNSHKGDFGHVLVVAGREGQFGAGRLAADAALAVGAGTSTLGTTAARLQSLSSGLYEVMATALYEDDLERGWTIHLQAYDALVVGPGFE